MFKKKEGRAIFNDSDSDKIQTIIGPSIDVRGDFEGQGDVIVEGKIEGSLKTKNNLRVGPEAEIKADVEAENIYVAGRIQGNLKAINEVELAENSQVNGDIATQSLIIEKGAVFNGQCVMTSENGPRKNSREKEVKEIKKNGENGLRKIEVNGKF